MSLTTWHKDIKSLKNINQFLFKNETMSDCCFLVKDGESTTKIPAHKYILCGYSPEFYNLFYLMEANSNEIPIDEFSVESVTSFLEFLYTEKTDVSMENIIDILKLAKRYSVECLKTVCGKFLLQNITVDNVLSVLDSIDEWPEMETKCLQVIGSKRLCFEDPLFVEISIRTLTTILKSKELEGFTEIMIFEGTNKWTERFCAKMGQTINSENKRLALGDAFQYIRNSFRSMTIPEFTKCSMLDNFILTPTETVEIFQLIGSDGEMVKPSSKNRSITKLLFHKDPVISWMKHDFTSILLLLFTVNKPIFLHGFEMYGRRNKPGVRYQDPEKFLIRLGNPRKMNIMEDIVEIDHDGSTRTYEMLFGKEMLLEANELYDIHLQKTDAGLASGTLKMYGVMQKSDYLDIECEKGFTIRYLNQMCASLIYSLQ